MASVSKLHFFSFFLSLVPVFSAANVTLGSSLSTTDANSPWLSPSEEFAFGFKQLSNSNLFLLSIWFHKIPDKTIVWNANGDNPVEEGSSVVLSATGLVLNDHKGQKIWEAKLDSTVSYAAMLDSGNFVLAANNSSYVWESFKNPTDTILPTQILDLGTTLSSRLTTNNFSRGRFELHFVNGNLQLNPVAWPTLSRYKDYYSSNTYNVNQQESGYQLVFNESANIYIMKTNGEVVQIPSWSAKTLGVDYYYRATLDFDGVFTQYAHPKTASTNQSWQHVRSVPENICLAIVSEIGSGACGFNSYCSIQNSRPTCDCPPDYVFVDPDNRFSGCKPTFPQGCDVDYGLRDPEELYEIRQSRDVNVNWPLGDYERLEPYNQTQCEKSCLHDCSCAVAIFNGVQCWKKKLPLSNGRVESTGPPMALFKVKKEANPGDRTANYDRNKDKSILLGAVLGSSAFLNVVFLVISVMVFMRQRRKGAWTAQDSSVFDTNLRHFSYKELEEATDQFQEEIGRGSFGIVYKGVLKSNSRNHVAVKKLDKLAQEREREMEFKTEVSAIGRTHHKNLVGLIGFCDEGTHRLLVYEFLSNGTLANYLFAVPRPDWNQRIRIALNIARGLVYLHEECNVPIIHCDIKPHNILLDEYLTAKISDFGLAKLLLSDQSRTRTMIRGTRGYVAPEWFKNVPITAKVDVYSFGVMLLEIICSRKSVVMNSAEEERAILTDWAYDCYIEGRLDVLTGDDEAAMADKERLRKWIMIALWCIQDDPANRPAMKMVTQMLEGFVEVPLPPDLSSFIITHEN
ncbi:hypothetical protein REPUB_Repub08aG0208600 [Reevesia pubescens]